MKVINIRKNRDRIVIRQDSQVLADVEIANSSTNRNAALSFKIVDSRVTVERVNKK